jgi:hypothetical protein
MADIQKYLDDTKNRCEELTQQIEQFKTSREVNQAATDTLIAMTKTFQQTVTNIEPLTVGSLIRLKYLLFLILASSFSSLILALYSVLIG